MSETQQTTTEVFESLTGFDEMAIAQHFGRTITELASRDESMFGRALVFVLKRRDGASDDDARNEALGLTIKQMTGFLVAEESDEEVGKGEQLEPSPESSPSSVSSPDEAETSSSV